MRTKKESRSWDAKISDMFHADGETRLVKHRYRALRYLLSSKYIDLKGMDKFTAAELLKDCVYLDRKLRLWTEGQEKPLKKQLAEEFVAQELL